MRGRPQRGRPLRFLKIISAGLSLASSMIVASLISIVLPGCSGDDSAAPTRILKSEIVDGPAPEGPLPAPAYRFEFLEPKQTEFPPGHEIQISARLILPSGEKPPTFVQLLVKRGKVNVNSLGLEPTEDDGSGTYNFSAKLNAPEEKGRYALVLSAIKYKTYQAENGRAPESRSVTVDSEPLVITVRGSR